MARIKTEKQYKAICARIEELLKVVGNDTPADDKNFLELDLIWLPIMRKKISLLNRLLW